MYVYHLKLITANPWCDFLWKLQVWDQTESGPGRPALVLQHISLTILPCQLETSGIVFLPRAQRCPAVDITAVDLAIMQIHHDGTNHLLPLCVRIFLVFRFYKHISVCDLKVWFYIVLIHLSFKCRTWKCWLQWSLMVLYKIIILFLYFYVSSKCFAMNSFYLHHQDIILNYAVKNFHISHSLPGSNFVRLPIIPGRE